MVIDLCQKVTYGYKECGLPGVQAKILCLLCLPPPPPRKQPSVKFKESDGEVDGRGNIIYGAIDFGTVNTGFALGMPSYRSMQVTLIGNDLREQSEILLDETKQ